MGIDVIVLRIHRQVFFEGQCWFAQRNLHPKDGCKIKHSDTRPMDFLSIIKSLDLKPCYRHRQVSWSWLFTTDPFQFLHGCCHTIGIGKTLPSRKLPLCSFTHPGAWRSCGSYHKCGCGRGVTTLNDFIDIGRYYIILSYRENDVLETDSKANETSDETFCTSQSDGNQQTHRVWEGVEKKPSHLSNLPVANNNHGIRIYQECSIKEYSMIIPIKPAS